MGAEVFFRKALVSGIPYAFRGIGVQEGVDAKAAAKFEMGPVKKRIANCVRNGFSPGLELIPGRCGAGDMGFRDSICPHGTPLVVIFPEP